MLINFGVTNWMSFRDETTLTMVASRERRFSERVARHPKHRLNLLPVAVLYGANASGKSNLFKAINFAKRLITNGTQLDERIAVQPFRLDTAYQNAPTSFVFEFIVGTSIYEYRFSVTYQRVISEKLTEYRAASEVVLFERVDQNIIEHHMKEAEKPYWGFMAKAMRPNQLFLTTAVNLQHLPFMPIFHWFRDTLLLISPSARFQEFERFVDKGDRHFEQMNRYLAALDTGIHELSGQDISLDMIPMPEDFKQTLQRDLHEGYTARIVDLELNDRIFVTRQNGELKAQKIVGLHQRADGGYEPFSMIHESDGTNRIIDLLPAFLEIIDQREAKVIIIDEVDRSLHTLVTKMLIQRFLRSCAHDTHSQLLLTLHDVLLMDQNILRRDEMWLTDRGSDGASKLTALSDFEGTRADKDLRKSYLLGRFGGIPRVLW